MTVSGVAGSRPTGGTAINSATGRQAVERRVRARAAGDALFLPDFCGIYMVFVVVVLAELLAFVLVLARHPATPWEYLGLTSLYIQWVALTGAAALCLLRRYLMRFTNAGAATLSYLLLLGLTLLFGEIAWQLIDRVGIAGVSVRQSHAGFLANQLAIAAIVCALALRYFYVRDQWQRQIEAESEARLQALHSRIRPHFLFNSMNTIASLTRSQPAVAEEVVQDLADLFRVTLADASHHITLQQELAVAYKYLQIEKHRLGSRLRVTWQTDALPAHAMLPSLILQPLLENAVYHGIEPSEDGGEIDISGHLEGECITLIIRNTLPPRGDQALREGNRLALDNIRQRFAAFFEDRGKLFISQVDNSYQVRLVFPLIRSDSE